MELRPTALAFVRLGFVLVLASFAAGAFELSVLQTPYSPLHLPLPASPAADLRAATLTLALFCFPLAWLVPRLSPEREPWPLFGLYLAGCVVKLLALAFAAGTGMLAIQLVDPRPGATTLVAIRFSGEAFLLLSFVDAARRILAPRRS